MKNEKLQSKILKFSVVVFSFSFLVFRFSSSTYAVTNPISYEITVSTTIGESRLTLFGWTSPSALVQLEGQRVSERVIANDQGYFFFDRIFLPRPTLHLRGVPQAQHHLGGELGYPELCLTSIDSRSRASFPTCLPPLPLGSFDMSIGPVLLPPTLSLFKGSFLPNEQVAAQGLTIPDSEVNIFLANNLTPSLRFSFIPSVYAYFIPRYQIKADANGHFEFNLPASKAEWKVFAAANYLGSPSPKSNTLTFRILGWWEWLWEQIRGLLVWLFAFIKPHLLTMIILIELVIIGSALIYWRNLRRYGKNSSLPKSDL